MAHTLGVRLSRGPPTPAQRQTHINAVIHNAMREGLDTHPALGARRDHCGYDTCPSPPPCAAPLAAPRRTLLAVVAPYPSALPPPRPASRRWPPAPPAAPLCLPWGPANTHTHRGGPTQYSTAPHSHACRAGGEGAEGMAGTSPLLAQASSRHTHLWESVWPCRPKPSSARSPAATMSLT